MTINQIAGNINRYVPILNNISEEFTAHVYDEQARKYPF